MEMNKISGFSMNAGYKPGVKVCPIKRRVLFLVMPFQEESSFPINLPECGTRQAR